MWTYRAASDAHAAHAPAGVDGRRGPASGEGLFRSWHPPALLKNEALPSPRAALRRLEGEGNKREARLALANDLLDSQKGQDVGMWAGRADFFEKDLCRVSREVPMKDRLDARGMNRCPTEWYALRRETCGVANLVRG